jgi:TM2 domain-containing membrane protein YozV
MYKIHLLESSMKLLIFFLFIVESQTQNVSSKLICSNNINCGSPNGQCVSNQCICSRGWIITDQSGCTYQLKSKLTAFLLSFFVGFFGVDWFYLSLGNGAYIIAGIIKLITCGGFGIWWIVDWIRLLANAFLDGNGIYLLDWNN